MMSSNLRRQRFSAFLLGCAALANSVMSDKMEAVVDISDPQRAGCNDLSCEINDDKVESPKNMFLDVINSNPSVRKENYLFSPEKDKSEDIISKEASSPITVDDTEPSSCDKFSGKGNCIEMVASPETANEDSTSKPKDSPHSDSQEDSDSPSLHVIGRKKFHFTTGPSKQESEADSTKHKLFPFLYTSLFSTCKSLLRSFLSEFIEDSSQQDGAVNTSEWSNQSSLIANEETSNYLNTTSNSTDPVKRTRFQCAIKNVTTDDVGKVRLIFSYLKIKCVCLFQRVLMTNV